MGHARGEAMGFVPPQSRPTERWEVAQTCQPTLTSIPAVLMSIRQYARPSVTGIDAAKRHYLFAEHPDGVFAFLTRQGCVGW